LQADASAGIGLARVVTPQKRNKAAWNGDNRRKKRAGNVSDNKAEPAPLGVERVQRSAKKAETKRRAPLAMKGWAARPPGQQRGTGLDGHRSHWEDSKKAEDQEAGIDARKRMGRKTARATSAMRTAQRLHQRQRDAGDDASGNFAKEGEFA
jgi:hypothetical protein